MQLSKMLTTTVRMKRLLRPGSTQIHLPPIQEIEASAVRPVGESPVAKVRETVRTRVSYLIVGSTVILGFCLVGAYLWGAQNVKLAISGVFTPLLGVTGVIVGYYFGGKDHTAG